MFDVRTAARRAPTLALAATLLLSALGTPPSVSLAADPPEPAARLQILVKEVKIHDDRDTYLRGAGDIDFTVGIWRCKQGEPPPCSVGPEDSENLDSGSAGDVPTPLVRSGAISQANSGETVSQNRTVPDVGDLMWGGTTTPESGFAVYPGYQYVLHFEAHESDGGDYANNPDYMGQVFHFVDLEQIGLGVGPHTVRGLREDGVSPGDFTVTYEIRRMQLPDLRPVSITVDDLPNSPKKRLCTAVQNVMTADSGPFLVNFYADGKALPGETFLPRLASADSGKLCIDTDLPAGPHQLRAVVDGPKRVVEFNEANNVFEQAYTPPAQVGPATSEPKSDGKATATPEPKSNGKSPNGKDGKDGKDGK